MKRKSIWVLGALGILCGNLMAAEMPVPTNLQVAIFEKIFSYDKTLQSNGDWRVVVVYENDPGALRNEVVAGFQGVGIPARAVKVDRLDTEIGGAAAAYVLPGVSSALVKELCAENGVLSISGLPSLAEEGDVSISIGTKGRKPQIIIHMGRVRAEGHELSAEILKLAKLIR